MNEHLLTPNRWSRPGRPLDRVRAIVIHWFAGPGHSAAGVRDYWEARKSGAGGFGSAHLAIDDHETVLAIPLDEIAYHVGADDYTQYAVTHIGPYPNAATVGVELAHDDWTGKPSLDVWERAVTVVADLCDRFRLGPERVVTHYDITGPRPHWPHGYPCHRWFVEQPGEFARFRLHVRQAMRT